MTGTFGYRQKCIKRRQHLTNKCSVVDRLFISQTGTLDKKIYLWFTRIHGINY